MASLVVQFSDSTQKTIVSYFGSLQDESQIPNLGSVQASDPRWGALVNLFPPSAQAVLPTPSV
ncbi:hypothetical protein SAMN05192539_1001329 [Paraburkholderia diazotrophica]|uniref:Uncharacterized protein n=1 Tax=Paraburkholderia diazotrophica TaxID=667676 RepID=A0A1H6QGF6_9BURK|nr:hypothetical protein SAMN05192539_1001329 [Paraburkholderia diazotrophica]